MYRSKMFQIKHGRKKAASSAIYKALNVTAECHKEWRYLSIDLVFKWDSELATELISSYHERKCKDR